MRVFVGTTLEELAEVVTAGAFRPTVGQAVTPAIREWFREGDAEELEYAAFTDAAKASLGRLASDAADGWPPRRVVLAIDVADAAVTPDAGSGRSGVRIDATVPLDAVAAGHVDDADAESAVREAIAALPAARTGDTDAAFVVDEAFGHELLWYARQELAAVVAELGPDR